MKIKSQITNHKSQITNHKKIWCNLALSTTMMALLSTSVMAMDRIEKKIEDNKPQNQNDLAENANEIYNQLWKYKGDEELVLLKNLFQKNVFLSLKSDPQEGSVRSLKDLVLEEIPDARELFIGIKDLLLGMEENPQIAFLEYLPKLAEENIPGMDDALFDLENNLLDMKENVQRIFIESLGKRVEKNPKAHDYFFAMVENGQLFELKSRAQKMYMYCLSSLGEVAIKGGPDFLLNDLKKLEGKLDSEGQRYYKLLIEEFK